MNPERKKILERVAKLLAMAEDASSPNEAAIAARRAKALMDQHNINEADTLTAAMTLEDFQRGEAGPASNRYPKHLSALAVSVAQYAGCYAKFGWAKDGRKQVFFEGEVSDLELARYLFVYLGRQIEKLTKEAAKTNPLMRHIGPRTSFKKGCAASIVDMLNEMRQQERAQYMEASNSKALVLVDKKAAMLKQKFGVCRYTRSGGTGVSDGGAYHGGKLAGEGVSIRKGVNGGNNARRIGNG